MGKVIPEIHKVIPVTVNRTWGVRLSQVTDCTLIGNSPRTDIQIKPCPLAAERRLSSFVPPSAPPSRDDHVSAQTNDSGHLCFLEKILYTSCSWYIFLSHPTQTFPQPRQHKLIVYKQSTALSEVFTHEAARVNVYNQSQYNGGENAVTVDWNCLRVRKSLRWNVGILLVNANYRLLIQRHKNYT